MNRIYLAILGLVAACVLSGCAGNRVGEIMQMRLAEIDEIPGLFEYRSPNPEVTGDKIYVAEKVVASDLDIERADPMRLDDGTYAVAITLTESAAKRVLSAWSKDLRGRLAIFVDGRPVCTIPMFGTFDRYVVVSGRFSRDYAEAVANRLNRGKSRAIGADDLDPSKQPVIKRIDMRKNMRPIR